MAKLLLAIVLIICGTARSTVYMVSAGTTSADGNWILRGYYPLGALAATATPFAIEEGDSVTFIVGGFAKAIVITDRLFIPIVDDSGAFDPAFTSATSASPITVQDPGNATYSSGLLPVGENVTFTFITTGSYEIFEIMEGKIVATIVVNLAGTPGPYSPTQIDRYAHDAISQDEVLGFEQISAATDATAVVAGSLGLSFNVGQISFTGFAGGNPISVVIGTLLKFVNRDVRPLNVFINASGEFNVPALPFGGSYFLVPSGDGVGAPGTAVSSGLIYPGQTYSVLFSNLGTFEWHSTISGAAGNITVVNPPPQLRPLSGGRAFAAFVVVVAVLLLIFVIGCVIMIACKYACIQAKQIEAAAEKSLSQFHITDDL